MGMTIQGVEPDVLYRKGSSLCAVLLASPLGLAYQNPIRSPITGSRKTAPINETLQQQRAYPVPGLPIPWQLPGRLRKQSRSQIPALDPRKDQKPGLPHDASQSRFTLLVVPVNPAIPRLQPPGARSIAEQSHQSPAGIRKVSQLSTRQRRIAQIMITVDVLVPQMRVGCRDDFQSQLAQLRQGALLNRLVVVIS